MDNSTGQTALTPIASPGVFTTGSSSHSDPTSDPRYAAFVPAPAVGSSTTVTDHSSPFFIHSNNGPGFKWKYPEAAPTPEGEDDHQWNKIYTAADSRKYNHHGKSSSESKKFRGTGETYTLAMKMLVDNKEKYATAVRMAIAAGQPIPSEIPRATPKPGQVPKATPKSEPRAYVKKDQTFGEAAIFGGESLSISEKIKSQGRVRQPSALSATSLPVNQSLSPSEQEIVSSKKNSPAPRAKTDKMGPKAENKMASKKRPNDSLVKAVVTKKTKIEGQPRTSSDRSATNSPAPRRSSTSSTPWAKFDGGLDADGNEIYCSCRGPDDGNERMVNCKKCDEWFHHTCIGYTLHDVVKLMEDYYCTRCTDENTFTKFRRLCRFSEIHRLHPHVRECREPADVLNGSKYCSERCGIEFYTFMVNSATKLNTDSAMGGRLNVIEVAKLLVSAKTFVKIQQLGQKPVLERRANSDLSLPVGADYISENERFTILSLEGQKQKYQDRINLCEKAAQLLRMVDERAQAAAQYLGVDPSAICGYDKRLAMNESQFIEYFKTPEAINAFETGHLGPPTSDSERFTMHIPCHGVPPFQGCEVPEPLKGVCSNLWMHNHKSKKNCKHNTVGGIWWRNKCWHEYQHTKHSLRENISKLDLLILAIYETAEEREILKGYNAHNITEKVGEASNSI